MQKVMAVFLASSLLFPAGTVAQDSKLNDGSKIGQSTGATAPVTATTQQQPLIVELFGAWLLHSDNIDTDDPQTEIVEDKSFMGWNAGATLGNRWLGLTTSVAQTYREDVRIRRFLVGPAISHRGKNDGIPVRIFAQALAGTAFAKADVDTSDTGSMFVVGGGWDVAIFRMQFDYVRFNLEGPAAAALAKSSFQATFGGVLPLCFRHCSDIDFAFDLSRGK
jgi:hypothetical protein